VKYSIKPSFLSKNDKKEIIRYLEQYSSTAPVKFKKELKKYLQILNSTPYIFAVYNTNPEYRHVVVYGSYVLFYTVDDVNKEVFVYRILHGAQDIGNII